MIFATIHVIPHGCQELKYIVLLELIEKEYEDLSQ